MAEGKATQLDDEGDRRRLSIAPTGQTGPARRSPAMCQAAAAAKMSAVPHQAS
jgi:hypothetical protein